VEPHIGGSAVPAPHARRFWIGPTAYPFCFRGHGNGCPQTPRRTTSKAGPQPTHAKGSRGVWPGSTFAPRAGRFRGGRLMRVFPDSSLLPGRRKRRPASALKTVDNAPSSGSGRSNMGSASDDVKRSDSLLSRKKSRASDMSETRRFLIYLTSTIVRDRQSGGRKPEPSTRRAS
jgi:hypothetical protein